MKVVTSTSEINSCLSLVQNIFGKKTSMPILNNVFFSCEGEYLRVIASNIDISVLVEVPAEVLEKGKTTVSGRLFSELCRELPGGEVTFTKGENERLDIVTHKTSVKIVGQNADEFPTLPGIGIKTKSKIQASALLNMIQKTMYAVSTDEGRYNLNGVCFTTGESKDELRLVATDGTRLALISRKIKEINIPDLIIVPTRGLVEIKKVLERAGETDVGLAVSDGFIVIETKNIKMSVRLIDGEFPDYRLVIPQTTGKLVKASASSLSEALKRVALLVSDKGRGVRFDFFPNLLRLSGASLELGEALEEVPIEYEGESFTVGFSAEFYRDFLNTLKNDEEVNIEIYGDALNGVKGAKLWGFDKEAFTIVMPVRV